MNDQWFFRFFQLFLILMCVVLWRVGLMLLTFPGPDIPWDVGFGGWFMRVSFSAIGIKATAQYIEWEVKQWRKHHENGHG